MEMTAGQPRQRGANRALAIAVVAVAAVAQLIVLVPFTISSGLVAPAWAIAVLVVVWMAFAFLLARLARERPLYTPLVPVANYAVWMAALTLGERLLGWTA